MSTRGVYQTRQQEAVIQLFHQRPGECLSAEEVHQLLEAQGLSVGKTTVYRGLSRLCESGALRRYAPQGSGDSARFQLNPCKESHLHIRCVGCGALEHLDCGEMEHFKNHILSSHGFSLDEGQTMLYGRCKSCAGKEQGK